MIENLPQVSGLLFAVGTGLAFAKDIRTYIFKRDRGECQCGDCIGFQIIGKPLSFRDGFNMNCAHYPDMHQPREDVNPDNGRLISALEHCIEEIDRGNHRGVALLYEKQTFMNVHWIKENGWKDIKPPLHVLYDCASANDLEPIAEYFRERL